MAPRAFTVFQDVPSTEAVKAKPIISSVMVTRSSARLNNIPQGSSTVNELVTIDKENVHPVTGERAGLTTASKKRKTNVLATKPPTPVATKKVKSLKVARTVQSQSKKRKSSSEEIKNKGTKKKDGNLSGSSRKPVRLVVHNLSNKLPRVEEESGSKCREPELSAQASIDSRCYELTVKPLADVSQAYEAFESTRDVAASPANKTKFYKDSSVEHDIRDFLPSSQTLASLSTSSTVRAPSSEPVGTRKFSTPERKQIYAAFTFSSPSPTSERLKRVSSNTPSELA